jgi:uncharacterized protein YndB with AHSA1/START domain
MRFERQIHVEAPPEKVFDYLADVARHGEWAAHGLEVRQVSEGPVGVGTAYTTTGRQFGRHTDQVTVTEYVPGKRFAVESTGDAGRVRNWFELAEEAGGTRLTKGMEVLEPALPTRVFAPVVRRVAPKGLEADLRRIKERLETGA